MKKKKPSLFYTLRVTEHTDIPGKEKLSVKERKVHKSKPFTKSLHIVIRDPEEREVILQDYHTKVKGYRTRYSEGNTVRWSTVYYGKNEEEIREILRASIAENKKTARTDISAISQMVTGRVKNKYKASLAPGSLVSPIAKFVNVKRTAKKVEKGNKFVDFENDLEELELQYPIKAPKRLSRTQKAKLKKLAKIKEAKIKQLQKEKEERKAMKKGHFTVTHEERSLQEARRPRSVPKVSRSEKLQHRRIKEARKRVKRARRK